MLPTMTAAGGSALCGCPGSPRYPPRATRVSIGVTFTRISSLTRIPRDADLTTSLGPLGADCVQRWLPQPSRPAAAARGLAQRQPHHITVAALDTTSPARHPAPGYRSPRLCPRAHPWPGRPHRSGPLQRCMNVDLRIQPRSHMWPRLHCSRCRPPALPYWVTATAQARQHRQPMQSGPAACPGRIVVDHHSWYRPPVPQCPGRRSKIAPATLAALVPVPCAATYARRALASL